MKLAEIRDWADRLWEDLPPATQGWLHTALFLLMKWRTLGISQAQRLALKDQVIKTLAAARLRKVFQDQLGDEIGQIRREYHKLWCPYCGRRGGPAYVWHNRPKSTKRTSTADRRFRFHSTSTTNPSASPVEPSHKPTRRDDPSVRVRHRRRFEEMVAAISQGPPDPFADKVQPEHIKALIALDGKKDERRHQRSKWHMIRSVALAVLGVVAGIALCWLFLAYNKPEFLTPLVTLVVGAAGGYGVGRYHKQKRQAK